MTPDDTPTRIYLCHNRNGHPRFEEVGPDDIGAEAWVREGCGVRVKALEWRENKETDGWYGIGLFGIKYQIRHDRHLADIGGRSPFQVYLDEDETLTVDYCGSLEAAKAAAQADYTARILAALEVGNE